MTKLQIKTIGPENGPVIVFLHGFMGAGNDWSAIARALPNHCCLMVDLPGHHGAPIDPETDLETVTLGLQKAIKDHGVISAHFIGYSLGGRVAMTLLRLLPECVQSIFLISASPGIRDPAVRDQRLAVDTGLADRLRTEAFPDFLDWWYDLPLFCGLKHRPEALQAMRVHRENNDPKALATAIRNFSPGRMEPCHQALADARVPIHYEVGALDEKYISIANSVKGSTVDVQIIPDCSHTIPTEAPDQLTQRIHSWLNPS